MNLLELNVDKELFSGMNTEEINLYNELSNFVINNKYYYNLLNEYLIIRNNLIDIYSKVKTVFINLDEREDRLNNIIREFENQNITNYERFSAIKFTDTDIKNNNKNLLNKYKCWKKMDLNYIKSASGCKMSHLEVLKKYKNCNEEYILIVEDDAVFESCSMFYLKLALNQLKNIDWDILYLSTNLKKKEDAIKVSNNLLYINKGLTTTAQIFKVKDINKIIKIIESSDIEIDNTYNNMLKNKYCIYPMCVYQQNSYSDINKEISDYGEFHKNFSYE